MTEFNKDDKVKVMMADNIGWVVGIIKFKKTLIDGRTFYYVQPERMYKDGVLSSTKGFINPYRLLCIPAYSKGLVTGA